MATTNSQTKKQYKSNMNRNCKIVPNLLLNYTYALNPQHTKFISTGFDASTFEEKIILNDTYNGFIELNCLDWYSIFVKLQKINGLVHHVISTEASCKIQNKINISNNIKLQIMKDDNMCVNIVIHKYHQNQKQIIALNYLEYTNFYALSEFLHLVITYNRSASPSITAYFQSYMKKCEELNMCILSPQHYFLPPTNYIDHNTINYSRLWYEFSFLCYMKLYNAKEDAKKKSYINE